MDEKLLGILKQALLEVGSDEDVTIDSDLVELGLDSLGLLTVASGLEKTFNVKVADDQISRLRNVRYIVQLTSQAMQPASMPTTC